MDNDSAYTEPSVSTNLSLDETEQEISNPSRQSSTSLRLSLRMRKLLIFILMSFVYFLNWSCISMWAPFFPGEAAKRGVSSTETGFIFGTYSLVAFLASLFYGPIVIPQIGPYFVLFSGLFVNGGANVVCGFVNLITDTQIFSILCFVVRAVGALGGAACETAIVVVVTQEFHDNLTIAIGLLEVFCGLGFIAGPVLGGVLYSFGGFRLPFIVTGGLLLISLPLIYWLLPRKEYQITSGRGSLLKQAMTTPGVLFMCMACFVFAISMSYIDPILEPHVKTFGLDSTGVALIFLSISGPYIVCSPIIGHILNKKSWGRTFLVVGSVVFAASSLFFGPAPFIVSFVPAKKTWILVVSFAVSGVALATFYVPVLPEILQCCHERGLPKGLMVDSLASGLYTGFCNLGSFAGPVLGGALNDVLGFPWTSSIFAFLLAVQAVILAVFFLCNRRGSSATIIDTEKQQLLGESSRVTYNGKHNIESIM